MSGIRKSHYFLWAPLGAAAAVMAIVAAILFAEVPAAPRQGAACQGP